MKILVRVPATTANLGPGFDALGLALDLWNETVFAPANDFSLSIRGEGAETLPRDSQNLIVRAAKRLIEHVGAKHRGTARQGRRASSLPCHIDCLNRIPPGAGLGSSAAAVLSGLLGAYALLGKPLGQQEILQMAVEMDGHPDNVAPALLGGLVVSMMDGERVFTRHIAGATDRSRSGAGAGAAPSPAAER